MLSLLNLTETELGSVDVRASTVVLMMVPFARASGGSSVRKRRAGFAQAENGLNLAVISVMNFVIILGKMLYVKSAASVWSMRPKLAYAGNLLLLALSARPAMCINPFWRGARCVRRHTLRERTAKLGDNL